MLLLFTAGLSFRDIVISLQGFFCKTEEDFNDWCQQVRKLSLLGGALPMFELVEQQPPHLACPDVLNLSLESSDVERLERFFDSEDEDFEILSL